MAKCVLMCGLPGSGKTTCAKKLEERYQAIRLCTDDWHAALGIDWADDAFHDLLEAQLWRFGKRLLSLGQSVIFEKGLWLRKERDEKRQEAQEQGFELEFHVFDVPLDELKRRLKVRNESGNFGSAPISERQLERYAEIFQLPTEEELAFFAHVERHSGND